MGTHRAALDFAAAIMKDMGDQVPSESLSEREIVRRRRKAVNGGMIPRLDPTGASREPGVMRTRDTALGDWLYGREMRYCDQKKSVFVLLVFSVGSRRLRYVILFCISTAYAGTNIGERNDEVAY